MSNLIEFSDMGTKTIDQIRKDGLDQQMKERISAERAEMQRIKQEAKERLSL